MKNLRCVLGFHIPVKVYSKDGVHEYFCQECAKPMTQAQWKKYFRDRPDILNYYGCQIVVVDEIELPEERLEILK